MLSALQERIAQVIAAVPEADGFAPAGGAALVVRGEVDRETRDLDFFATEAAAVSRLLPAAEAAPARFAPWPKSSTSMTTSCTSDPSGAP